MKSNRKKAGSKKSSRKNPSSTWQDRFDLHDGFILTPVFLLLGLGILTLYSSSSVFAGRQYGDAEHFLTKQITWIGLGLLCLVFFARARTQWLYRRALEFWLVTLVLLVLVLIPGIGHLVSGARRWIVLFGFGIQPSEFAKLSSVMLLAVILARRQRKKSQEQTSLLYHVMLMQIPVVLILLEPDLGTAIVLEGIILMMVFVAGLEVRVILLAGLAALPVLYHLIVATPFRLRRILGFIDPWAYRSTVGYQITEALISLGSGGVIGEGLGKGKQKLFFLPEAHTDFIFAILGEELGFVGTFVVISAFLILILKGLRLAMAQENAFHTYLALGLTALIGLPALINICVVTSLLPTKGLSLPFMSYGGSNLLAALIAIGVLLRISRDGRAELTPEAGS
jgi:cell division protein FtsW